MKGPLLSYEQYKILLEQQALAEKLMKTKQYKDLAAEWGIAGSTVRSALYRGIKQYDIRMLKEMDDERRRSVATGSMARRDGTNAVAVLSASQGGRGSGESSQGRVPTRSQSTGA